MRLVPVRLEPVLDLSVRSVCRTVPWERPSTTFSSTISSARRRRLPHRPEGAGSLIGQKAQAPPAPAFRGFRAGQLDELCFLLSIELAVVFAVRGLALDAAGEATLTEAPSDPCDRTGGHFQRLGRAGVRPGRTVWAFVPDRLGFRPPSAKRERGSAAGRSPRPRRSRRWDRCSSVSSTRYFLLGMAPWGNHSMGSSQQPTTWRPQIHA